MRENHWAEARIIPGTSAFSPDHHGVWIVAELRKNGDAECAFGIKAVMGEQALPERRASDRSATSLIAEIKAPASEPQRPAFDMSLGA